jgi:hypothetical protein
MAEGVRVTIDDRLIISALNTPGGGVFRWRDEVGSDIKVTAEAMSPINDPLNARHRGGVVGTYKAGWDWDRRGSSGHHVVARVTNSADHAIYVEFGRTASSKMQIFSWTAWGGDIRRIGGPRPVPTDERGRHRFRNRGLSPGEVRFNARISTTLPPWAGSHTGARAGQHILGKATVAVLGSVGISARVD